MSGLLPDIKSSIRMVSSKTAKTAMLASLAVFCHLAFLLPSTCFAESQRGRISYYWKGQMTASGERFNTRAKTCAHPRAPFGSNVTIHIKGRKASCRVNDRGPFIKGRVLDVSVAVAEELGLVRAGVLQGSITW